MWPRKGIFPWLKLGYRALLDGLAVYQLVAEVTAHQGSDG